MKYALINFIIVLIINLLLLLKYKSDFVDIMLFRNNYWYPIWLPIITWLYVSYGIFNLVWFIFN